MKNWNQAILKEQVTNISKKFNLRSPQIMLLLAQERFLARLCSLDEGKHYIWKGGSLLVRLYSTLPTPRYTVDIDFLLRGMDIDKTQKTFEKAMSLELDDGFVFSSITNSPMERETPYGGERYEITWSFFDKAGGETLKIDVCTGDDVTALSMSEENLFLFPLEKGQGLSFQVYPSEFIFAEKLETVFHWGTGNTRIKDFIDLWTLAQGNLNPTKLEDAITRCFERRQTSFDKKIFDEIVSDEDFLLLLNKAKDKKFQNIEAPSLETMLELIRKKIPFKN